MNSDETAQLRYLQRKFEDLESIHQEGKRAYQLELDKLKKSNKDYIEQLSVLKKKNDNLECKMQEMKKLVLADQSELKSLRHKMRVVEQEKEKLSNKQDDIIDLKKALRVCETKKKEELQEKDKKFAEVQKLLNSEQQKLTALQGRFEDLKKTSLEEAKSAQSSLQVVEERCRIKDTEIIRVEMARKLLEKDYAAAQETQMRRIGDLQKLVECISTEYGRLASASVTSSSFEELKLDNAALALNTSRLERKLASANDQVTELAHLVRYYRDTNQLLLSITRDTETQKSILAQTLDDNAQFSKTENQELCGFNEWFIDRKNQELSSKSICFEIAASINELFSIYCKDLILHYSDTSFAMTQDRKQIDSLEVQLSTALETEARTAQERSSIAAALEQLKLAGEGKSREIIELTRGIEVQKEALAAAREQFKRERSSHESNLEKERSLTRKLNSTIQQSRIAEETLRAEIERLSAELEDAEAFKDAYGRLSQEVDNIVARNALAEDEAEHLSKINAEILGHRNPTQRIFYVDKIRKELADTKQKLLMTTLGHEAALDENAMLRNELSMYKSVTVHPADKPRTTITRISRMPFSAHDTNKHDKNEFSDDLAAYLPPIDEMTIDEIT